VGGKLRLGVPPPRPTNTDTNRSTSIVPPSTVGTSTVGNPDTEGELTPAMTRADSDVSTGSIVVDMNSNGSDTVKPPPPVQGDTVVPPQPGAQNTKVTFATGPGRDEIIEIQNIGQEARDTADEETKQLPKKVTFADDENEIIEIQNIGREARDRADKETNQLMMKHKCWERLVGITFMMMALITAILACLIFGFLGVNEETVKAVTIGGLIGGLFGGPLTYNIYMDGDPYIKRTGKSNWSILFSSAP